MDYSPRLGLPLIVSQQAQKQVTYNEAVRALDALVQPAVLSRTLATPPASPVEGDAYVVAPAATGAWTGHTDKLAVFCDGGWDFRAPAEGWLVYVLDDAELVIFSSGDWTPLVSNGGTSIATFGVNTSADATNRLAVAADATLLTHDGASHRLNLNKASAGATGSLLLQTGFSGRAELGLTGDDDFHVKVSADGATWLEALTVARASGLVTLPRGQLAFPASQNASSSPNVLDDYKEGTWTPSAGVPGGTQYVHANQAGRYTKIGRLVFCEGWVNWSSLNGAGGGGFGVSGLPFAPAMQGGASFGYVHGVNTSGQQLALFCNPGATYLSLASLADDGYANAVAANSNQASGQIQFSIVYSV